MKFWKQKQRPEINWGLLIKEAVNRSSLIIKIKGYVSNGEINVYSNNTLESFIDQGLNPYGVRQVTYNHQLPDGSMTAYLFRGELIELATETIKKRKYTLHYPIKRVSDESIEQEIISLGVDFIKKTFGQKNVYYIYHERSFNKIETGFKIEVNGEDHYHYLAHKLRIKNLLRNH